VERATLQLHALPFLRIGIGPVVAARLWQVAAFIDSRVVKPIIVGGAASNVPVELAWKRVQDGRLGTRNACYFAWDCFHPQWDPKHLWLQPVTQAVQIQMVRNAPFADRIVQFSPTLSPVTLAASETAIDRALEWGRRSVAPALPMIERLMELVWWEGDGPPVVEHESTPPAKAGARPMSGHHRRGPQRRGPGDPPATAQPGNASRQARSGPGSGANFPEDRSNQRRSGDRVVIGRARCVTGEGPAGNQKVEVGCDLEDRGHAVHRAKLVDGALVARPQHAPGNVVGRIGARRYQPVDQVETLPVMVEQLVDPVLEALRDRAVGGEHPRVRQV
jgi:hypothetical protein